MESHKCHCWKQHWEIFFWLWVKLRVKPCHTLRLFSFFSGQPSWMRIKSFPLEWRLLCSKSSYIVNLVGDTPMNWYIFWVLSCSRDSSQKFRSSSWSTSTEQNFPCELCIFSRKQSGFLVQDLVQELVFLLLIHSFLYHIYWLPYGRLGYMVVDASKCISWYVLWYWALLSIYIAIFTSTFFVQDHCLTSGPCSGWESISEFCFWNLNV